MLRWLRPWLLLTAPECEAEQADDTERPTCHPGLPDGWGIRNIGFGTRECEPPAAAVGETRSMFDRYGVIDEADLARAVATRYSGKQLANTPPAEPTADSLSSSPA